MIRAGLWVVWVLVASMFAAPVLGQSDYTEGRRATAIARTVQSPFCPGKTLDACPSPAAAEWRSDIRSWVASGATDQQIRQRLQARVPEVNLDGRPMGESSWWIPVLVLLTATGVLGTWAARHVRLSSPDEVDATDEDGGQALEARLQRELEGMDA